MHWKLDRDGNEHENDQDGFLQVLPLDLLCLKIIQVKKTS